MRRSLALLGLAASLMATPVDWKITTAVTWNGRRSVSTEYVKGSLRRMDQEKFVSVVDSARGRQMIWAPSLHQYTVLRLDRLNRGIRAPTAGPRVDIERSTTDTGERRSFFGYEARHLITREKRRDGSAPETESTTDGWYVDVAALPSELRGSGSSVYVLTAGNQRPSVHVRQTGPAAAGVMVLGSRSLPRGTQTIEVTELLLGELPDNIFQPPAGFERVIELPGDSALPWADRLRRRWEMLEDWFAGLRS